MPVAYAALRRLAGERPALAAAALVAVAPLLSWYALDARAYGLLVLTGLLSVWATAALLDAATPRRLALWALAAAAAIWTHWFAGFLVLGELVALLWLRPRARRGTLVAAGAALLALAPLVGLLREQAGDERAAFIADAGLGGRLEQLARQFAAGPNVPRTWLEALALAVVLGGLAAGGVSTARTALGRAAGAGRDRAAPTPRDGARALLAIAAVALLVPLALAASGLYDRLNVRNVLFLWPLAAALAAPALLRLRALPLAAALALGIGTTLWVQADWRYEHADWRGALRRVEALDPARPVLAVTPLGAPVVAHYLDRAPATTPLTARRAWLVVEPARTPGHRDLRPVAAPAVPGFAAAGERTLHGFRLIALTAAHAVAIDPARLAGAVAFASAPSPPAARATLLP